MFAPPPRLTAEIHASLPEPLRKREGSNDWLRSQPYTLPGGSFLEGPVFDRDGNLYCTDVAWGRIFRMSPQGEFTVVAEYDGEPNGMKFHRDGRLFIADFKQGILVLDTATGRIEPFLLRARSERFKGVNDLTFASNGDLYFTDQGMTGLHDSTGRVFRCRADGRVECLLDNVPSPNGLVLNAAEDILYLAVTRANAIWRVPLLPDGGVTKVGTFIQMSGGGGPDGLAIDEAGNLVVAHVGMGAVWVFTPRGEPLYRIDSPAGANTTNVAYGGADYRELFVTESESASILRVHLPVPGRRLFGGP